jgi:hypothetical protein
MDLNSAETLTDQKRGTDQEEKERAAEKRKEASLSVS